MQRRRGNLRKIPVADWALFPVDMLSEFRQPLRQAAIALGGGFNLRVQPCDTRANFVELLRYLVAPRERQFVA